jgi:hypothetical protein
MKKLADASRGPKTGLREDRGHEPLGGVGCLLLLQPIEQPAQGLKFGACPRVGGEGPFQRLPLLVRRLAIEHRVHRVTQFATIHLNPPSP